MAVTLTDKSREEIQALAILAESFWKTGIAPRESPLRKICRERKLEDNGSALSDLTSEIFRECYLRGIGKV